MEVLSGDMEDLEHGLASERDALQRLKHERDALKNENGKMKGNSGMVTNPMLLDDMEVQKAAEEELQTQVAALMDQYDGMTSNLNSLKATLSAQAMVEPLSEVENAQPPPPLSF